MNCFLQILLCMSINASLAWVIFILLCHLHGFQTIFFYTQGKKCSKKPKGKGKEKEHQNQRRDTAGALEATPIDASSRQEKQTTSKTASSKNKAKLIEGEGQGTTTRKSAQKTETRKAPSESSQTNTPSSSKSPTNSSLYESVPATSFSQLLLPPKKTPRGSSPSRRDNSPSNKVSVDNSPLSEVSSSKEPPCSKSRLAKTLSTITPTAGSSPWKVPTQSTLIRRCPDKSAPPTDYNQDFWSINSQKNGALKEPWTGHTPEECRQNYGTCREGTTDGYQEGITSGLFGTDCSNIFTSTVGLCVAEEQDGEYEYPPSISDQLDHPSYKIYNENLINDISNINGQIEFQQRAYEWMTCPYYGTHHPT